MLDLFLIHAQCVIVPHIFEINKLHELVTKALRTRFDCLHSLATQQLLILTYRPVEM